MLQNAYFLAKIGADTAENEQHFAKKLPKIGNPRPKTDLRDDQMNETRTPASLPWPAQRLARSRLVLASAKLS